MIDALCDAERRHLRADRDGEHAAASSTRSARHRGAALPGYAYIDTGVTSAPMPSTSASSTGPAAVEPVGASAILASTVDPRFIDTRNRPALAQTFEEVGYRRPASRSSSTISRARAQAAAPADDDTTDRPGQLQRHPDAGRRGPCRLARAPIPPAAGDPDVLIIGDLNSYAKEDPIVALQDAGYTDLVAEFGGPARTAIVFDGQLGYLDHAMSNPSLHPAGHRCRPSGTSTPTRSRCSTTTTRSSTRRRGGVRGGVGRPSAVRGQPVPLVRSRPGHGRARSPARAICTFTTTPRHPRATPGCSTR